MPARAPVLDPALLERWCAEHLGSPSETELFRSGLLSAVVGLRLADGREVVVKVRPASPRLVACIEVQRRLHEVGFPCPEPLTDPVPFGDGVATAERYVPGGAMLPDGDHASELFAVAFALLITRAPQPVDVGNLDPAPSWAAWNHDQDALWPQSEDGIDLNAVAGPDWIDWAGRRARDRLRADASEHVIGHCDWLAGNLRWTSDKLLVVHDWDSTCADSEAVLAGFAAALHSTVSPDKQATVAETERFLDAYCEARGQAFSTGDLQRSWAAGAWTRAYDAKYQHVIGDPVACFSENEARERLRRAGIS